MTRRLLCAACFGLAALPPARSNAAVRQEERLPLPAARTYMLELINRDRTALGLPEVQLDAVASDAGQRHAEEMASHRYLSHWDRAGRLPDQRYTEAGGTGAVSENVYLVKTDGEEPIPLDEAPTFSKQELEEIEAAYFNQKPPLDRHRKNLADRYHTHVGIGLARAHASSRNWSLANTQEFVRRIVEVDRIPLRARVGDRIPVSGCAPNGYRPGGIEIARCDPLRAFSRQELIATRSYTLPRPYDRYEPAAPSGAPRKFQQSVRLSDEGRSGVYLVAILVLDPEGRKIVASRRTVVVE